jgi:hypothetical protein
VEDPETISAATIGTVVSPTRAAARDGSPILREPATAASATMTVTHDSIHQSAP